MNMSGPYTTIIQSCHMTDLNKHTDVFNISNFADVVCVKLPNDFPRDFELTGMYNLEDDKELDYSDYVIFHKYRPWVDVSKSILNTDIGQHIYRLDFTHPDTYIGATCWFSYIIQDNHPDQPYIYMKRDSDDPEDSSSDSSEGIQ